MIIAGALAKVLEPTEALRVFQEMAVDAETEVSATATDQDVAIEVETIERVFQDVAVEAETGVVEAARVAARVKGMQKPDDSVLYVEWYQRVS
jgi:HEAT repeat protein